MAARRSVQFSLIFLQMGYFHPETVTPQTDRQADIIRSGDAAQGKQSERQYMNKLDALSRRGKGMQALVRLIKTAITGCGACMLIVSSTHLQFGGVTHALDDENQIGPNAFSALFFGAPLC